MNDLKETEIESIGQWLARDEGPARGSGSIRVGSMASGAKLALPWVAVRGARPGKTLWLHGQVHGDEINGMVAALRFVRGLDPQAMAGNVVVTPTGNPHALDLRRKRNPLDDLDLDQTFPGSSQGLVTERVAHALMAQVKGAADVLINLHTMNPLFGSVPYTVYKVHPDGGVSEDMLLAVMAPFFPSLACRMSIGGKGELPGNIAGALDYQCLAAGICAFMLELGSGSCLQREIVAQAGRGFDMLSRIMGILPQERCELPRTLRCVKRRGWITADEGGLFIPAFKAGDTVAAGQSLGERLDLQGGAQSIAPFEQDGVLIGLRRDPVIHTGERLAFVAWQWQDRSVPSVWQSP